GLGLVRGRELGLLRRLLIRGLGLLGRRLRLGLPRSDAREPKQHSRQSPRRPHPPSRVHAPLLHPVARARGVPDRGVYGGMRRNTERTSEGTRSPSASRRPSVDPVIPVMTPPLPSSLLVWTKVPRPRIILLS